MMKQQHVLNQIPDYALDLLPQAERIQVEQHTMRCANCRAALRSETELGSMVRATLAAVTHPPTNLRRLMPIRQPSFWQKLGFSLTWQRQLAPLVVFALLLLGSLGLYLSDQPAIWSNPSPTFLAATATMTDAPTATMTETRAEQVIVPVMTKVTENTAVSTAPSSFPIAVTPAPNPTPITAVPAGLASN